MPLRLRNKFVFLVVLLLGMVPLANAATSSERAAKNAKAPYEIQSDEAVFDQNKGEGIYSGHVQMDKGSQHIKAQRVKVMLSADNKVKHIFAFGNPVKFTDGSDISGHAKRMEYDIASKAIHLHDDAKITQGDRVVTGTTIIYHTEDQRIEAKGKQGERVKLVLPPEDTSGSDSDSENSSEESSEPRSEKEAKPTNDTAETQRGRPAKNAKHSTETNEPSKAGSSRAQQPAAKQPAASSDADFSPAEPSSPAPEPPAAKAPAEEPIPTAGFFRIETSDNNGN